MDGEAGAEFDVILGGGAPAGINGGLIKGFPTFSPDGKHVVSVGRKGTKWLVAEAGAEFNEILGRSLMFSPDGKRMAYAAKRGAKWLVVVDGLAGAETDSMSGP